MNKLSIFVLLFVLYLNLLSQSISYNQEFEISPYSEASKSYPSVSKLTSGGAVVCWSKISGDGTGGEIISQIYDENLVKVGDNFIVSSDSVYGRDKPCVTNLKNGGFAVCWQSRGQDGSSHGIFAQRFDEIGNKLGSEFQVNTFTENWQMDPCIANLNGGGFVICWESLESNYGNSYGIFAQRYDEYGVKVGSEFMVNTDTTDWQLNPSIAGLSNGGFIICWNNGDYLGLSEGDVLAQIYDEYGVKVGEEFIVNSEEEWDWQGKPVVCSLSNGEFIICWESNSFTNRGILGQRFKQNGLKIDGEFTISNDSPHILSSLQMCELPNSGFAVSYVLSHDGWIHEVSAQLYDSSGTEIGIEFQANDFSKKKELFHSIACLENGNIFVCWSSLKLFSSLFAVMGNYYLAEPIDHNLISYELLMPEVNANLDHANPKFTWNHASNVHINFPWELTYDLYIDTDISFSNPKIQSGIQDSTFQIDSLENGQTYYWKVLARNNSGDSLWSTSVNNFTIDTTAVVGINIINHEIPGSFNLFQNYPNPFNPTTKIKFTIPNVADALNASATNVSLKIYDILGNEIVTLVNEQKLPGTYEVEFNGESVNRRISSGIYFYKLSSGSFSQTKKMLFMK